MTGRRPLVLLVNPGSGGKPAAPRGDEDDEPTEPGHLLEALRSRGLDVTMHVLSHGDDPGRLATTAVADGRDVVAAGGDGTVGPIAAALTGTDATLGILPLGSWNNLATALGIPTRIAEALDLVVAGNDSPIDVGLAWHPRGEATDGPPADVERFFEAAGVGADAELFGTAELAERRGLLRAIRTGWRVLRRGQTPMVVETDDDDALQVDSPTAIVCNGPYVGLGFAVAPDANIADGLLNVVVFEGMTRWGLMRHFLAVARRRPRHEPQVVEIRARRVVIRGPRRTLPVHVDGRSIGTTPIAFAVDAGALRVFR